MRIDASGNVGIGAESPTQIVANTSAISLGGTSSTVSGGIVYQINDVVKGYHYVADNFLIHQTVSGIGQRFWAGGSEAMRIDSSGNLLVGKTSTGAATAGIELNGANDLLRIARDGGVLQELNRITNEGDIIEFRKDNTKVGSIGVASSRVYIGTDDTGLRFTNDEITPFNPSVSADRNGTVDLGGSSTRFKDLYLSGGAYLGGTAAANKLDDYEEGVFSGTVDGTTYSGEYTKVGNLVTISCYYDCSAATNNRIAIVPFACSGVVSTQNSGAGITASTSATHPEGTSACVFGTTANVYAYSYARATLGTPSTGNGSFQFTYYTTE
jgi:hypothetical protein